MKLKTPSLLVCLLGTALSAHAEFVLLPNGDFGTPGGVSWKAVPGAETDGTAPGGGLALTFPADGGNTGGFAQINLATGNYGVFVADDVSLASLGLSGGMRYAFQLDMKILDGSSNIGGLKIECPDVGFSSGDRRPAELVGDGGEWASYTIEITLPENAETIRFVPLWGGVGSAGAVPSNVGFDNIGVDNTPIPLDPPPVGDFLALNGDFESGGAFWSEASDGPTGFSYPDNGGSPNGDGGYAAINFTTGNFAVIFDEPTLLSSQGLIPGETYIFSADMINLDGPGNVGRLKIEFPGATPDNFGDMPVDALKGDGSTWQTYEWSITIPANATTIKFVPVLLGLDGPLNIGYDNIGGSNIAVEPPPFVPAQIPNPGFELDPLGVNWATTQTTPTYVETGGNPDRFVQLTDGVGDFAVLYAFNGAEVSFASLGLSPGDSYQIQVDMKVISEGTDPTSPVGGLRLQGPEAFVQEFFPALKGEGSTWERYTIDLVAPPVPSAAIGIRPGKSGGGATIAFDNIQLLVAPQAPFTAAIEKGTVVTWEPSGTEFTYQAQKSSNGVDFTNFGPLITGDEVSSSFDAEGAAFYQVVESSLEPFELVTDPGFEDESETWNRIGLVPPTFLVDPALAFEGNVSARMAVATGSSTSPLTSTLQQFGLGILPTDVLDFSFRANVESNVGANIAYSVKWRAENGTVIDEVGGNLNSLTVGQWTEISLTGLVPPAGTSTALIQFDCATGAVAGQSGAVRIDNVSFVALESADSEIIAATSAPGVQVSWPSKSGSSYQPKSAMGLSGFTNFGPVIEGDGEVKSISDTIVSETKFYEIDETP